MIRATPASYALALGGVALVAWATSAFLPVLGIASAALLFLLPVLLASSRAGLGPGLVAALAGAAAYNFFLLPPRFSFRIHAPENLASVGVLVAVALVTSRLATNLRARETEAFARAAASEEAAQLSALLASVPPQEALTRAVGFVAARYGELRLLAAGEALDEAAFSSLDQAAAAWAMHNGDTTGHGTQVMPAAEWSFLALAPKARHEQPIAALARPADGTTRDGAALAQLSALCRLLGQGWDRAALEGERRERVRLDEADHLRRAFLASLAHDFRTPVTVIAGRLEGLARDHPEAREALAQVRRLDRMMEDLIGAARIEDGSLAPRLESIDLVDAAAAACEAVVSGLAIMRDIPVDLAFAQADPVLLHHILVNLLDNAQRHARRLVRLSARAGAAGLVVQVEDDGPGVPTAERARVFERFARIEGGDRAQGSGLGLAIVKGFADAMGMSIELSQSPLGGACFALTMPQSAP